MKRRALLMAMIAVSAGSSGCTASAPAPVRGIELEEPGERLRAAEGAAASSGLIASAADPADTAMASDGDFVHSRDPSAVPRPSIAQLPIHINASWWSFRGQHVGLSEEQAQKRDARLSRARAPAAFWDPQTSIEAVSVWSVLCNECHGGRRSVEDALEMPQPGPEWGEGEGLFFGNRRSYSQMFNVVYEGGPVRDGGRAKMPAWRNILSTEMIWSLLYFLEYQSGGIESRFPPSLYPRPPKVPGAP